jgi:hypothetical protein
VAVARQRPADNIRGMMFFAQSAKQQLNSNRGAVFPVRSMPRCYKQNSWGNELVVGQSPASKNVSMEAEDSVGISHQETTGEKTAD